MGISKNKEVKFGFYTLPLASASGQVQIKKALAE
jgi:hypothetical protein